VVTKRQIVLSEIESDVPIEEDKSGQIHPNCWHVHQNMLPLEYASIKASSHQSSRLDASFDHICEFFLTFLQIIF
jgi:hypothetical protein